VSPACLLCYRIMVDIYITRVHNKYVGILPPPGGLMRSTIAAVLATAVIVTAGCASAAGQPIPPTNGLGPIKFAIGSDDIGWLSPVIAKWNAAHPRQRVTPIYLPQAANIQLDQLVANLQAKSPAYDVIDMDVVWTAEFAVNGWIIPLP